MFDLKDFIKTTISGMIGQEPDYKVREYALGWFNRSELTQDDLAELDAAIVEYNTRPPEPEIVEPLEPNITDPIEDIDPGMMVEPEESIKESSIEPPEEEPPTEEKTGAEEQSAGTIEQTENSML